MTRPPPASRSSASQPPPRRPAPRSARLPRPHFQIQAGAPYVFMKPRVLSFLTSVLDHLSAATVAIDLPIIAIAFPSPSPSIAVSP